MKLIPLTRGYFAKVDDEDFEELSKFKWHVLVAKITTILYAHRSTWVNGKTVKVRMHRFIMKAPKGAEIDHINGDGLDNRKANLRICAPHENKKNRSIQRNRRSTEFIGVAKAYKGFSARIWSEGKCIHLGTFKDPTDAAKEYDKMALKLRGPFAKLNFTQT